MIKHDKDALFKLLLTCTSSVSSCWLDLNAIQLWLTIAPDPE